MDEHKINDWYYWWTFFFKKEKYSNIKKRPQYSFTIVSTVYPYGTHCTYVVCRYQVGSLEQQAPVQVKEISKPSISKNHRFYNVLYCAPSNLPYIFFLHSIRKPRDIYQSLYSKHMGKKIHPILKSLTSTINLCNFLSQLRSLKKLSKSSFLVKVSVRKITIPQQTPIQVSQKYQIATFETFGNDKCTNIYIMYIFCMYIYGKQKYV